MSPPHPPSTGICSRGLPGPEGSPLQGRVGGGPTLGVPASLQRPRPAALHVPKQYLKKASAPRPGTRWGSQAPGSGGVFAACVSPHSSAGHGPGPQALCWPRGSGFQSPRENTRAARPGTGARGHARDLLSRQSGDLLLPPAPRSGHPSPRHLPACLRTGSCSLPCPTATTALRTGCLPWPRALGWLPRPRALRWRNEGCAAALPWPGGRWHPGRHSKTRDPGLRGQGKARPPLASTQP